MKRILTNIAMRKMAFSLIGVVASFSLHAYDLEQDGLGYTILPDRDHCVEVSYAEKTVLYLSIPSTVTINDCDYTVVSIGKSAFSCRASLRRLELPSTLETIGPQGLYGVWNLDYVKIPDNVTTMDYCSTADGGYYSLIIPDKIEMINGFFDNCRNLHTIVLGKGVKGIKNFAFNDLKVLREMYVLCPDVPALSDYPFWRCDSPDAIIYVPKEALDKYRGIKNQSQNLDASIKREPTGYHPEPTEADATWSYFHDFRPIPDLFMVTGREDYVKGPGNRDFLRCDVVNYAGVEILSDKWVYDPEIVSIDGDIFTALAPGKTTMKRVIETSSGTFESHEITLTVIKPDPSGVDPPVAEPAEPVSMPANAMSGTVEYFTIDGMSAGSDPDRLARGIYIERDHGKTRKFIKR